MEVDESPAEAAMREVREEASLAVELGQILGAFGGAPYRVGYPNGDAVAYVTIAYDAEVVGDHAKLEI